MISAATGTRDAWFDKLTRVALERGVVMTFSGPLEDRMALRELLDAYADAVCRHDAAAWATTWVEDCLWVLPGFGEFSGKALVVDTWQTAMEAFPGIVFRAWPGAMTIDGDRASMRSYTSETYTRDGVTHHDMGVYDDICSKVGGRWHFVSRNFLPLRREPAVR
ncbi:nuclear transport factor 2 family protein [Sphingopyxis sp.]|uniref:nuclear transport factor 2 family protein n=1 Tax=Sphingopyxis sp. TaxID=1908224 RepID=UPI003BAC98E3